MTIGNPFAVRVAPATSRWCAHRPGIASPNRALATTLTTSQQQQQQVVVLACWWVLGGGWWL